MEIDVESVRGVFRAVLTGQMTREAADRWAYALVQQSEAGSLIFVPQAEKERIWDAIMYLYGVDSMEAPGEYLHTDEDIQAAMRAKFGEN